MSNPRQVGPTVSVHRSCFDCAHCESVSYAVQGDSGHDVYCVATGTRRTVGDTTWETPSWCPAPSERGGA